MHRQIITMLDMQQAMNAKIHPQWRQQNFPWYRAIWVESSELLEHYGWKWWKQQSPDMGQVNLELIDIWHFGLSDLLQHHNDHDGISRQVQACFHNDIGRADFYDALEAFVAVTLNEKHFAIASFATLTTSVGLSFDELYRQYLGKNVLNIFRQNNGYKQGKYKKIWGGREDNEHLVEAIHCVDLLDENALDLLHRELERRYSEA